MSRGLVVVAGLAALSLALWVGREWISPRGANPPVAEQTGAEPRSDVPGKPPHLEIEKTEVDAGEIVPDGKPAKFAFVLKNTGEGPLKISVTPHCGCTVVHHDEVIAPGKQGKIEVALTTASLQGAVKKSIDVSTNDAARPRFPLTIAANVLTAVEVLPAPQVTFPLKMEGPTVQELRLRPREKDHVEITGVKCNKPDAQAVLEPTPDEAGGRMFRLIVTFQPEAPIGGSSLVITLSTTAELQPEMPILIFCEKGILALPDTLHLKPFGVGGALGATGTVIVRKREGTFQIQKAVSSDPNLEVKIDTIKAGSFYRLKVTTRKPPRTRSPATIAVETDDPHQPHLEIPITYLTPSAAPPAE